MLKMTEKDLLAVCPAGGSGPSFSVKAIHISCKSDTYLGPDHKYGGIILYGLITHVPLLQITFT